MFSFLKRLWKDRRGNALVIAAGALPLIVGSAGLATDTIEWALWKRQLQRVADSAAIAGVYAKMAGQTVDTQVTEDITKNNQTKITLLGTPTINSVLPNGADYNNAVSVGLQLQKKLSFSSMFLDSPPIISANATAAAVQYGHYCVISLENTNTTGISAGGSAKVDLGCGMVTNSVSMDAAVAFGSSSVNASPVAAVGGLDKTDNWAAGTTLLPFTIPQPDPFKSIDPPAIPSPCNSTINDKPKDTSSPAAGCYKSISIQGDMTLSGTYVVTGDVTIGAQAVVTCSSCTIILTNSTPSQTGNLSIDGGAQLNMSAPTTGTYAGLLFYQDRGASNSTSKTNKINGNSLSTFQGAFYFPNQDVEFTGTAGLTYTCLKLVGRRVTFQGNSTIKNNCPANSGVTDPMGRHVRLVA